MGEVPKSPKIAVGPMNIEQNLFHPFLIRGFRIELGSVGSDYETSQVSAHMCAIENFHLGRASSKVNVHLTNLSDNLPNTSSVELLAELLGELFILHSIACANPLPLAVCVSFQVGR